MTNVELNDRQQRYAEEMERVTSIDKGNMFTYGMIAVALMEIARRLPEPPQPQPSEPAQ